jgi:hypothetical protein
MIHVDLLHYKPAQGCGNPTYKNLCWSKKMPCRTKKSSTCLHLLMHIFMIHGVNHLVEEAVNSVKITQDTEESLRVCHLASSANPTNTSDSLDICHSEKYLIKNDTSIKPKRQNIKRKCKRTIHMYNKSPKATHL